MINQKSEGLFQFSPHVQRKAAELEIEKKLKDLYDIADDLEIHIK